ncbi:MAG: universal stress protein [Flavobacteriaceae bacterium]
MTNILIPTDFSDNSWNAIRYALQFFKNCSCTFYLLHVNETAEIKGVLSSQKQHQSKQDLEYKNKLNQLIQKIEKNSLKYNHRFFTLTANGIIVDAIRNEVQNKRLDLIVMGTQGANMIHKATVGSNTTDVLNKVKCNLLVVPENASFTKVDQVALPTDYSIFFGPNLLNPIDSILRLFDAKLHIIHVTKSNEKVLDEMQQNRELLADYFSDSKHEFHSITHQNMNEAIQKCVEKHQIKLIAMVAKNIHFFQQLFFNPEKSKINYQKKIPFLVLHE